MKVAGFTFIRNAVKYDFPVVESISSVLPLCDAFFVAVGQSEDQTLELIRSIPGDKIRMIETVWDDRLTAGGAVYASETNKAMDAIPEDYDWCFYIQGDEVLHENYLEPVKAAMGKWIDHPEVEGLLFGYRHFYGNYDYVGDSRHWYRNEVRVIRNDKSIRSYRDAQGFRKEGRKIGVAPAHAEVYHYGWVRHPRYMQQKIDAVRRYYGEISPEEASAMAAKQEFDYDGQYDALARFAGTHPEVMKERIQRLNWSVEPDLRKKKYEPPLPASVWIRKINGHQTLRIPEFQNY